MGLSRRRSAIRDIDVSIEGYTRLGIELETKKGVRARDEE